MQTQLLRKPPTVVTRAVAGELVLLDLTKGTYFTLNEVGAIAWRHFEAGLDVDAIADAVCAEYEVGRDVALADLERLLAELREAGLLEVA